MERPFESERMADRVPLTEFTPPISVTSNPTSTKPQLRQRIRSWPTREGFHFAFLIAFILVGAIIRDVNLLVILAGVLVAMLLLQWRIASRSMHGIVARRRLPKSVDAGIPFEVEITVRNTKKWLGVWLLLIEDRMSRSHGAKTVAQETFFVRESIPKISPLESSFIRYECKLPRRGCYQFGPLELSTVFPMGLIQTRIHTSRVESCLVFPPQGELKPTWRELFRMRRPSGTSVRSQSAAGDGEFYGLRDYRVGDSPRWIHWRTSARRNELAVRQFEKQDGIEACILLDLCADPSTSTVNDAVETAVEFVATLVTTMLERTRSTLSIAVAGTYAQTFLHLRSRVQLEGLMNHLAVLEPLEQTPWLACMKSMQRPLRANPMLVVVSTRSDQWKLLDRLNSDLPDSMISTFVRWIDVSKMEHERYFERGKV